MANVTAKDFHVTGFREEAKEAKGLNGYSYTDIYVLTFSTCK